MTTRLAMVAGPPLARAATHTAMNAPDVPMMSTWPDPTRPTRMAWSAVVRPLTMSAAKTPHDMYESGCPAIRATITTVRTTGATIIMAAWTPAPMDTGVGGFSSGS